MGFGPTTSSSAGHYDLFLARLDAASGNGAGGGRLGGPEEQHKDQVLAVSSTGAVYRGGVFSETVDLGGVALTSAGAKDLFLLRVAP